VFSTSWQNDQTPAAMGLYMNQKGVKSVFLIGPNYAAGKDMLAGLKSTFKGEVKGEEYTVWPEPARLLRRAVQGPRVRRRVDLRVLSRRPPACSSSINMCRPASKADAALHRLHHRRIVAAAAEGQRCSMGIPGAQEWVNDLPNETRTRRSSPITSQEISRPASDLLRRASL
jgi:branched-chain amino acid transport system substrate-binding protein